MTSGDASTNSSAGFDPIAKEAALRRDADSWDISTTVAVKPADIPVVDVAEWFATGAPSALETAAETLRLASSEVGFHQLTGHGIDAGERHAILDMTRRFHELPAEIKAEVAMDQPDWPLKGCGWLGYDNHKLPSRSSPNRNSAFIVKSDVGIGFDQNLWLADEALPGFRSTVERWARTVEHLALRLLPLWARALDLEPDWFGKAFDDPFWRLRLTHYPPTPAADGHGINPHVDTTFFTLLLTDGPGLRIFNHPDDAWIEVPVLDDAFIVNSGELLRQWSNDVVLSTRHFAVNPEQASRYSVPFFFNPNADWPMACLPSCSGPDNPPRYPTISYRQSQGVVQGE